VTYFSQSVLDKQKIRRSADPLFMAALRLGHTRTEWFLSSRKCARFCKVGYIIKLWLVMVVITPVDDQCWSTRHREMMEWL